MKHVHLIGIGGTGLSAIALVLLESGITVSGSDRQFSPLARRVQEAGGRVVSGHRAENVQGADLVVRSSAIPDDNVEVRAAHAAGIPVLKRSEFLAELMAGKDCIAIAGSHGKTTTTAMVASILSSLGQDPSFIIGGVSANLGTNAHAGRGKHFVIEADEYDNMFLGLNPQVAVITNIEHDHPDCFPTPEDFYAAFEQFAGQVQPGGALLACSDDPGASRLLKWAKSVGKRTYSYSIGDPSADVMAGELAANEHGGYSFRIRLKPGLNQAGSPLAADSDLQVVLQVPGEHNVRNALAALGAAALLGLPLDRSAQALGEFQGTERRFQVLGEASGVVMIDDYAHHPTEIRATLAAARDRYAARPLWVVWQPHTYSRTRTLYQDFLQSFNAADHLIVTDIYAAREAPPEDDFSSRQIVADLNGQGVDAYHIPGLEQVAEWLLECIRAGDVLLVLSAGDAVQISARVMSALQDSELHGVQEEA